MVIGTFILRPTQHCQLVFINRTMIGRILTNSGSGHIERRLRSIRINTAYLEHYRRPAYSMGADQPARGMFSEP